LIYAGREEECAAPASELLAAADPMMTPRQVSTRWPALTLGSLLQKIAHLGEESAGADDVVNLHAVASVILEECNGKDPYEVLTTRAMARSLRARDGGLGHSVAVTPVLEAEPSRFDVSPYLLGAWLGDGSSGSGSITVGRDDVEAAIS